MRKYILKFLSYFKRKGYQENPLADELFASVEADTNTTEYSTVDSFSKANLPTDVIAELKKAQKEVQEFENTLKSIKQNTTV